MDPYFNGCLVTLGGFITTMIVLNTVKWSINLYFKLRKKLPERCIIVRYKNRYDYNNSEEILIIRTDTPRRLYDEIMTTGPHDYIYRKYGIYNITIKSIDIIGDDINYDDGFLIKIAKFMGLEIKNVHSKEDMIKLIDDHIRYNPNTTINEGYIEAKDEFNRMTQDV